MAWTVGGSEFLAGQGFSPVHIIQTDFRTHSTPIQQVPWALSLWVKWPGHEAEHLPPTSAKVKITRIYTSAVAYVFMA
jgi:hypothetical protein